MLVNIHESFFSKLTETQKKAVEAAGSPEEMLALAKEAGYELSPDQLDSIAGGDDSWCTRWCGVAQSAP